MHQRRASLVVADDHALLLRALKSLLELEFDLVATAGNGRELLDHVHHQKPDVAVTDIRMPIVNGLDVLRQVRGTGVHTKFVMYTAASNPLLAVEALRLGAAGYVLKQAASAELVHAVRTALEGRVFVSPRIAGEVLRSMLSDAAAEKAAVVTMQDISVPR